MKVEHFYFSRIIFITVLQCNSRDVNLNVLSISDALAAENLSLYDGVDDDELIAVAEFVENEQAAASHSG